jgi:hypothetical protein
MTIYVLENNNSVINGPRSWNYRSFESTLQEDLEINYTLPISKSDNEIITIDDHTHIYSAELIYPDYNQTIQYIHGPFWDFSTGVAIGTFEVKELPLEHIKSNLKSKVASNRYIKENFGVKYTVQNLEITIDTSRGNRDIFVQKYLLMADTDTVQWKFPEGWLTLTKSELGEIVSVGFNYVQQQFDWEISKGFEIDNSTTSGELGSIDVGDLVPQTLLRV